MSPYLLSAWYDGYDVGGGTGGHIVMKLTPSPTVMQFRPTSLNTIHTPSELHFYPNPASDKLYLTTLGSYSVISLSGVVLLKGMVEAGDAIDVSHLSSGMYWIQVVDSKPLKFIKQ